MAGTPNTRTGALSAAGDQPRPGGTLRLGILADLVSLDGHACGPFDTLYQVWDLLGVRWNLERVRDPKVGGGILASYVKPLASIETPDQSTIILRSDDPWPGVYDFIQHLNMLDPVTVKGSEGPNQPVGTGPFMFAEYAQEIIFG